MSESGGSKSGSQIANNIKVFLRLRPTSRAFVGFNQREDEDIVEFDLDRGDPNAFVNNSKAKHKFKFDGIFGMDATQEEVFKSVAVPVITDALSGVNGTIFAYGQTGSGKTYTITGGSEKYVDRGLIPRTISEIFDHIRKDGKSRHQCFISYLEIYNNFGYDLLSRDENATKLEELPKVSLREDEDGNMHLKNLSVNVANTEEDALNLLFLGDTNRVVAETPMNDASTRSHCIFIVWIQSSEHGSDTVRRSKIHLVDLAGSERVSKTGVDGKLLAEAKYINISLHFLEQVIVALQERANGGRSHVPYRNSMMTSVLRDSLGGNCKTVMLGTVALETSNVDESLSTCRFAQRVACIKNSAIVNEELDPSLMIKRLKREILELKDQLKQYQQSDEDQNDEPLSMEQVEKCRKNVTEFVEDIHTANFLVGGGQKWMQECFRQFRQLAVRGGGPSGGGGSSASSGLPSSAGGGPSNEAANKSLQQQVKQLQLEVAQRDQEIGILVSIVNRNGGSYGGGGGGPPGAAGNFQTGGSSPSKPRGHVGGGGQDASTIASSSIANTSMLSSSTGGGATPSNSSQISASQQQLPLGAGAAMTSTRAGGGGPGTHTQQHPLTAAPHQPIAPVPRGREAAELLLDRAKAFEVFRKSVRRNESFEENKELLRKFYTEAKGLGEEANNARQRAAQTKTAIQQLRLKKAMNEEVAKEQRRKAPYPHQWKNRACWISWKRTRGSTAKPLVVCEQ
ncbi:unnamed protein product [Amoebophrya sp. A25]|nr:unnamed protein product [Amoebophrya sp. A25]|eukprot:GSA25T00003325001.1